MRINIKATPEQYADIVDEFEDVDPDYEPKLVQKINLDAINMIDFVAEVPDVDPLCGELIYHCQENNIPYEILD